MKKINLLIAFFTFLSLCCNAQVVVTGGYQPDNLLPPDAGYSNSATIDYTPFCGSCSGGPYQLTAIVQDDGINPPMLSVEDHGTLGAQMSIGVHPNSHPDVIIGNDINTGNYLIGVISTEPSALCVILEIFSLSGQGTGSLTLTYVSGSIISPGPVSPNAHIDVIAQSSAPFGGLPLCDHFVATWQDVSGTPGIIGYYSSLNNPAIFTTKVIASGSNWAFPDVAGVERINGTAYEDWGIFTYLQTTSGPAMRLMEDEWNTSTAPSVPNILQTTSLGFVPFPRIDAIDNYNFNSPTGGNAYYTVAVSEIVPYSTTLNVPDVFIYNNKHNSFSTPVGGIDLCQPLNSTTFFGQQNLFPVVACGPSDMYTVGYSTAPLYGSSTYNTYLATAIQWAGGAPTPAADAYIIPTNPVTYPSGNSYGILSLAATCNATGGAPWLYACWDNNGILFDKSTSFVHPYYFKPGKGTNSVIGQPAQWTISPNPATDHLTIAAPGGTTLTNNNKYTITDISGRQLIQSGIQDLNDQVNITDLVPGLYFLHIYDGSKELKTEKFIKE